MDYWFYRLGILLVNLLPQLVVHFLTEFLGIMASYLLRRKRAVLRANLRVVLHEDKERINKIIPRVFCNYAHYYATLFKFFSLKDKDIARLIEVKGWERLERALELGRGAILVTGHIGHWDLGGAALARRFKVNVIAERLPSDRLFKLFTRFRTHQGMAVIASSKDLRRLYEALNHNEVVILLGDRDLNGRGVAIPFFGRMTTMPKVAAMLARASGAPVLSGFVIKDKEKEHYTGLIGEEIPITKSSNKKSDIELNTLKITRIIEDCIKAHPEDWYMLQPIWKESIDKDG